MSGVRPFKLTPPRILESDRQSQIIDWLRVEQAQGRVSWFCRVNGGGVKKPTQFIWFYVLYLFGHQKRSRGYPDIHGMLKGGRYFALEVKQPGEKPTPEQLLFLATVKADGGIAAVVTSFEDVAKVLNQSRVAETPDGALLQRNDAALGANKNPAEAGHCAGSRRLITD